MSFARDSDCTQLPPSLSFPPFFFAAPEEIRRRRKTCLELAKEERKKLVSYFSLSLLFRRQRNSKVKNVYITPYIGVGNCML